MTRRDPSGAGTRLTAILQFQQELRAAREQAEALTRQRARLVDQREILAGRHAAPKRLQQQWNETERQLEAAQARRAALEAQRPGWCKALVRLRLVELHPDYLSARLACEEQTIRYRALKAAYAAWAVPDLDADEDADPLPAPAANRYSACSQGGVLVREQLRLEALGIDPALLSLTPD